MLHLAWVIQKALGDDLVCQTPFGDSGIRPFFYFTEKEYLNAQKSSRGELIHWKDQLSWKLCHRSMCTKMAHSSLRWCTELVGFKTKTYSTKRRLRAGNAIYPNALPSRLEKKPEQYLLSLVGGSLKKEGYKRIFELDFLKSIRDNGAVTLVSLTQGYGRKARSQLRSVCLADAPSTFSHILEWMNPG